MENNENLTNEELKAECIDQHQENDIVKEISDSFLDYSMSVITSRAIPDLRDGLKPVHRRILWAMFEEGNTPEKPHKKSATTVGYVMGHYHPHGDSSIYEAMVRLAQDFNQRYMMVDGHGNFGNIDGDRAAAMRYTEARLSKISLEMLRDIRKNTVDMMPNFDETSPEPVVLPSRIPNVLVNGSMGIAVGMATNIPPHNLAEIIDGCVAYIDNPNIELDELMTYIKGPDFPTGGLILGNSGIKKAYETGRGSITIRSKATIEEVGNHSQIVITEVPYGVNTLELKNKVAELVNNKIIEGISDYHTELKNGIKITITLKRDANAQIILNKLYKHTNFQMNYGIIFLVIDNGTPKTLCLKDIISKYIDHQREVIVRRCNFDLEKAKNRVHILEGLMIALDNIEEVIKLIRAAKEDEEAKRGLMQKFSLTETQAVAILEMKLRRLTGLERDKIKEELEELLKFIDKLNEILSSDKNILAVIKKEMLEIKDKYKDERRTTIDMTAIEYIEDESLIPEEEVVIAITKNNYVKRVNTDNFKLQKRGGVGIKGMSTNEEDYVEKLLYVNTHDYILFFSNKGKVYRLKGYEIPQSSRISKGLPIVNLIQIEKDEVINTIIKISKKEENDNLIFATKNGIVKRTKIEEYENIRKSGKIAITLKEKDELISVVRSSGDEDIIMCSTNGRMCRFNENEIRLMGRTASGVRGINLEKDDICIDMCVANENEQILVVSEKGYGKRTKIEEYRKTKRGSKGVKTLNITDKNGKLIGFKSVSTDNDLMIMTDNGITIRIKISDISIMSRVTQGVKLMNIKDNKVSSITILDSEEEAEDDVSRETSDQEQN